MKKGLVGQLTCVKRAFLPGMAMQRQRYHVSSVMAAWMEEKQLWYKTENKPLGWTSHSQHHITRYTRDTLVLVGFFRCAGISIQAPLQDMQRFRFFIQLYG
ncbi:hypothetical protein [Chitinophaga sp.]|uniref:hypothetical protein n=1 Tax=Chitinophaga sp. TaxID=1869181 RepID=UPI0031D50B75